MRRQPRLDLSKHNYNFEQFRRYTAAYRKAKRLDDAQSQKFYKMVKYVKANIANERDPLVHKLTQVQGLRADLVDIPEEF